jgi:hypothetical protein
MRRENTARWTLPLAAALFLGGCGAVREKQVLTAPPAYLEARTASLDELLTLVNERYAGVESVTISRFDVEFTGGSIEDGYFERYRRARGYLVAQGPDSIFVNILNPLTSSSVLVMSARERRFQIWLPSRNQFVTGRTDLETGQENPVYNVRPSHILQGMLFEPIPSDPQYRYYVEEDQDARFKYYVLGILRAEEGSPALRLVRKIWVERSSLRVWRQQYYRGTEVESAITYEAAMEMGDKLINTVVRIDLPIDRYSIAFELQPGSVELNREVRGDAFSLQQPAGAELIEVTETR